MVGGRLAKPALDTVMTPIGAGSASRRERVVLNLRIHCHTAQRPTPPAWRTPSTHALVIRVHD
jgi:hypothetical protein